MSVKIVKSGETLQKENVANAKATAMNYPQFIVEVEAYQKKRYEIRILIPKTIKVQKKKLFKKTEVVTIFKNVQIALINIDLFRYDNYGTIIPEERENTELLKLIDDLSKGWNTKSESSKEITIEFVI